MLVVRKMERCKHTIVEVVLILQCDSDAFLDFTPPSHVLLFSNKGVIIITVNALSSTLFENVPFDIA